MPSPHDHHGATRGITRQSLLRVGRVLFYIIIFGFIAASIIAGWDQIRTFAWQFTPKLLLLAFVAYALQLALLAVLWTWSVRYVKLNLSYQTGAEMWLSAHLSRYLPGGIWPYATVATAGRSQDLSASLVTSIYILQFLFVLWTFALGALPLLTVYFISVSATAGYAVLATFALLTVMAPALFLWVLRLGGTRFRPLRETALRQLAAPRPFLILYIGFLVVQLTNFASVIYGVDSLLDLTPTYAIYVTFSYVAAQFLGLVVLFVPQGAGVRETAFLFFVAGILPGSVAIGLAVALRLMNTIFDLALMLLFWIFKSVQTMQQPAQVDTPP